MSDNLHEIPLLEESAADPSKARVLDAHTARILTTTALAALNALNTRELALAAERGKIWEVSEQHAIAGRRGNRRGSPAALGHECFQ